MRAKGKKKGALVPRLRFPEFIVDREWDCAQMGDIYAFKKNNSFSRDMLNYNAGDVKNIHYGDIHKKFPSHFYAENENIPFVNCNINLGSISEDCLCTAGDIIFADASEDIKDIGKCIEIISNNKERILSGLHTIFTRQFSSTLVIGFGGYLFQSPRVRAQIQKEAQGTKILGISSGRLAKISISFPFTKGEQQKIADCLSSLDERITAETSMLDTLKDHKKGLLKQLFPAEGETLPQLRFPEFRDAGEWEEKPLLSVADYENGKAYEPHIIECGRYIVVNSRFISTDGAIKKYSNEPICIAKRGDILMVLSDLPNGRALAKSYYVNADDLYAVNQRVCRLTPHSANGKFLCFLLDRHPNLLVFDDGKNQTHLKKNSVLQCLLKLPLSFDEQQRIADCLSSLDELITAQAQKIDLLKTHKKGLMQQLFPVIDKAKA